MRDLQLEVAEFVARHNLQTDVASRMLDLTSEVGELAKEVLTATNYGKTPFVPKPAWLDEFGDVLFALLCLADLTDVNPADALRMALAKYEKRMSAQQTPSNL